MKTVDMLLERIARNADCFGDQFPTVGAGKNYQLTANDHWLAGFWTGLLWLAYSASGEDRFRRKAESLLPSFQDRLARQVHITHDLGFLYTLSARAQDQLTGDAAARDLAIRAGLDLMKRWRGRYIQAWGPVGDPQDGGRMIIDTLMNLPLLCWLGTVQDFPDPYEMAMGHADTAAQYLIRDDGSTYHTYLFDQATGKPIGGRTHQGYADESLWARGQAWAIYGFAVLAQWNTCAAGGAYRTVATIAADRFMAELPDDLIPRWDLRLPPDAPQYTDTSASTIAVAGMLRLAKLVDPVRAATLRENARRLLDVLLDRMLETDPEGQGLLRGGTYHAHKQWGVDTYFICGDYFFLEALLMSEGRCPDFWGPVEH